MARPPRPAPRRPPDWLVGGFVDGRPTEVEDGFVNHDLAALRGKGADDVSDDRKVELARRTPSDHDDLCLAGPVHVSDRSEHPPVEAPNLAADDLVPVGCPRREIGGPVDGRLEVGLAEPFRRGA